MKVSLKDIAKKAGVSTAMVSLVINGKEKQSRINPATAEKINAIAAKMNYIPNRFAKGLKHGRSNILGLIVADISNIFYAKLARHIEDKAAKFGYKIIIGSSDENATKMASLIEVMQTYQVDGFIIVPTANSQSQLKSLLNDNHPLVLLDRYFHEIQANTVLVNNAETSYKATEYLINNGCKNIAAFSYKTNLLHFQDRIEGYQTAMKQYKIPVSKESVHYIRMPYLSIDVEKAINNILKSKTQYDGLLFFTDTLALCSIKILKQMQVNIQEQFKIVSFDENETFNFLNFPVPHFEQPLNEIAQQAIELMMLQLENTAKPESKKIFLSTKWYEK